MFLPRHATSRTSDRKRFPPHVSQGTSTSGRKYISRTWVPIPRQASLAAKMYLRLSLGGLRFGPTRDLRWLVADRQAALRCLDALLQWDFDRVTVRRGDVLERGGRRAVRRAYRWLRSEPQWWQ